MMITPILYEQNNFRFSKSEITFKYEPPSYTDPNGLKTKLKTLHEFQ